MLNSIDWSGGEALVTGVPNGRGAMALLLNNAGVSTPQRPQDVNVSDFVSVFDTNANGAFSGCNG